MKKEWKKGDWCFNEFELKQIMKVEGENVQEVSCGYLRMSSLSLNDATFPLTLTNKNISGNYKVVSKEMHKEENRNLNHPDINRYLIKSWSDCLNAIQDFPDDDWSTGQKKVLNFHLEMLKTFRDNVIDGVKKSKDITISGIKLFR